MPLAETCVNSKKVPHVIRNHDRPHVYAGGGSAAVAIVAQDGARHALRRRLLPCAVPGTDAE